MAHVNRVLWQDEVGVAGVIREQDLPHPDELDDRSILVKVQAWAMNPCDAVLQTTPLPFVKYPLILGQDVAGTIVGVGPGTRAASKFSIGDRVFAFTAGNNGFQDYVSLNYQLAAKIPDHIAYREAVVFPLAITTSSFALFGKDYLHLDFPKLNSPRKAQSQLIWGASSSAGSNAVQMAVGAGYDVVATCSPHNFDYVQSLGAATYFDYGSPTVI